jgi:tetratricopeptide (TPR) repeat protein
MGLLKKMFGGGQGKDEADRAVADIGEALQLYRQGKFEDALRMADRLIAAGPEVPLSWRFRGECLVSLGRYLEAVEAFDRAAAIGGKGTEDIFLWTALALHNGGRQAEAKERLQRALRGELRPELRARTREALVKLGGAT